MLWFGGERRSEVCSNGAAALAYAPLEDATVTPVVTMSVCGTLFALLTMDVTVKKYSVPLTRDPIVLRVGIWGENPTRYLVMSVSKGAVFSGVGIIIVSAFLFEESFHVKSCKGPRH